jgi:hypothetical protein
MGWDGPKRDSVLLVKVSGRRAERREEGKREASVPGGEGQGRVGTNLCSFGTGIAPSELQNGTVPCRFAVWEDLCKAFKACHQG